MSILNTIKKSTFLKIATFGLLSFSSVQGMQDGFVTANNLRIRSVPSMNSTVLGTL